MTITEELEQALKELEAKSKSLTEAEATIKAQAQVVEQGIKERDELKAKLADEITKAQGEAAKAADVLKNEMTARIQAQDGLKMVTAELELARTALANPAFAAAAAKGDGKAVAEGGAEAVTRNRDELVAEHNKIEDPAAQARFRAEHAKELGLA